MERILIIDDDRELCELVTEYLSREGFTVDSVHDGRAGIAQSLETLPDLVILDVMLPRTSGFDILRELRTKSNLPVLMLTARGDDVDRIVGLEIGADDYLSKPFNPRELVARIRAILRRAAAPPSGNAAGRIRVGDIEVDPATRTSTRSGRRLSLTTVEFGILWSLVSRAGRVVSRDDLSRIALGREFNPLDRSVDMHVSNLRRKLGRTGEGDEHIKTIRGEGYQFSRPDGDRE